MTSELKKRTMKWIWILKESIQIICEKSISEWISKNISEKICVKNIKLKKYLRHTKDTLKKQKTKWLTHTEKWMWTYQIQRFKKRKQI